jgi:large subunit ribosomal protein L18
VFRSNKHFYVQLIDDFTGTTLASASTQSAELKGKVKNGGNAEAAQLVGTLIAEQAKAKGISQAVLDRRHYKYHGRVKSLAEAAREAGLKL